MCSSDLKAEMKDAYEDGMEQGIEQGVEQGKKELVLNMLRSGISIEKIASMANLSVDRIREWDKMADQS